MNYLVRTISSNKSLPYIFPILLELKWQNEDWLLVTWIFIKIAFYNPVNMTIFDYIIDRSTTLKKQNILN